MQRISATSASAGRLVGLIENELTKPLLVSPDVLDDYARSLLKFGVNNPNQEPVKVNVQGVHVRTATSVTVTTFIDLGAVVLDVSGPLTNREISGPCMQSPVSYQAIRAELSAATSDSRTKTVIVRVDSGGGAASNMVDLADYIRSTVAANPQIRFIASIDDMAGSAAFGIVSAFPERYISRTGLAGSVGVVVRHTDTSGANAAKGFAHTYIFAGANKVLGNSDEPLSDSARDMITKRVGMHYDLFLECVSQGLGMSVDAVKATEANVYQGQDAVDIGFATGIMTFTEIMQSLENQDMIKADTATKQVAASTEATADATEATTAEATTTQDAGNVQQAADAVAATASAAADSAAADAIAKAEADASADATRRATIEAICSIGGISEVQTAALIAGNLSAEAVSALVTNSTSRTTDMNTQTSATMRGERTAAETEKELIQSWIDVMK